MGGQEGRRSEKFSEAFNSFGVVSQVKRGDQMAQSYKIQGVPALAVDGKYLVGGKDFNEQLAIADKLIAKTRSEKSGKGAGNK
jgi:thiol:disulfide interchange protein DsbA